MKKRAVSFILVTCMLVSLIQFMSIDAFAVAESTNVKNRLDEIVAELNTKLKKPGVFSANGKNCWSKGHTCNNCSLYGILGAIGENKSEWETKSSNGWSCCSFAKYVLVKTFGTTKDTKDTKNIGPGNKESTYSTFRTGDLFYSASHWMIFISNDSKGVNVLDANGDGKLTIRYVKYAYNSKNLSGSITVWQSPSWEGVNGTVVQPQPVLDPPEGLKAEKTADKTAKISWNAVSGATYYVEYRSPNTNNAWVTETDYSNTGYGNSTSYTATRLGNHKYEFRVYSVNSTGKKSIASDVLIYTHNTTASNVAPTAVPTNIKLNGVVSRPDGSGSVYAVTASSGETLTLTWDAVSNATKYKVEPMRWNGSEWVLVGSTYTKEVSSTSVSYDNLITGAWVFRVTAGNSAGWSAKYARWNKAYVAAVQTQGTVMIHYDANGGTDAPTSHSLTKDKNGVATFNLSSKIPTRNGYTFLGWRLENSTAYGIDKDGASISIQLDTSATDETLTYYAQWEHSSEQTPSPTPSEETKVFYDGTGLKHEAVYDSSGRKIKETTYHWDDNSRVWRVSLYYPDDSQTTTMFYEDGSIQEVYERSSTGELINHTTYTKGTKWP